MQPLTRPFPTLMAGTVPATSIRDPELRMITFGLFVHRSNSAIGLTVILQF